MTDSPALLKRLLVLPAVAGLLITPIATGAQAPNPDLLGISVGMPSNVARTTLQKRMPQSMLQKRYAERRVHAVCHRRLLTTADEGLTACDGNMFINNVRNGPPPSPTQLQQVCFRSFFAVTAMLNSGDEQLLQAYTIELVNLPYAHRAATATGNPRDSAAEKERQNLIDKANRKPDL